MSKTLITSDWHLTDKQEDSYRWGIFDFLIDTVQRNGIKRLLILGDLTEKKNRHSDKLVNMIREKFIRLSELSIPISILFGNHDYSNDPNIHFFNFLDDIENIDCINFPAVVGRDELFLPHTKNPSKDWKGIDFTNIKTVYMHQCIIGAKFANNYIVDSGFSIDSIFPKNIKIYSGDIHVPQNIGSRFTYVGAPYSIDYGDHYQGRVIIKEDGKKDTFLYPDFLIKGSYSIRSIDDLKDIDFYKGDKVKISIQLYTSEYPEWPKLRKSVKELLENKGVEVKSITMKALKKENKRPRVGKSSIVNKGEGDKFWLEVFCRKENLGKKYFDVGSEIIK